MNRPLLFPLILLLVAVGGCRAGDGGRLADGLPTQAAAPTLLAPTLVAVLIDAEPTTPAPVIVNTATAAPPPPAASATTIPPTATSVPATPTSLPSPTAPPCAEPGRIEHGTLDSAVAGEPMRYRVYLPPCYGDDGRVYPTLYMFGGNVHDDAIWDVLGLDEVAEAAIVAGEIPPLLIVMPDNGWLANTTTSGPKSYEGFVIDELIPHIEESWCAWPERGGRAVGGISRGGYWSLMMAFRRPELFRSVGAHSPALIDSHAGPAEDPAITGVTNDLGDLRIWIDIGERDPYLVQARPLHEALMTAGVAHEWVVNPGTHEEAYWREHLGDYLQWYSDGWRVERGALAGCD